MNSFLQGQFGDANLDACDRLVRFLIAKNGLAWYESLFEQHRLDSGWR